MLSFETHRQQSIASVRQRRFLGHRFTVGATAALLQLLESLAQRTHGSSWIVAHVNLHSVFTARSSGPLAQVLTMPCTVTLFEGIGLKLARYSTSGEWWHDVNGSDLVPLFFSQTRRQRLRVALVGGHPGVAARAAAAICERFRGLNCVLTLDGFVNLEPGSTAHGQVLAAKPDVVLLGLGTPLQETVAGLWAAEGTAPLLWCVGGLFDLWEGSARRAPKWVRTARMEWLWRLGRNPGSLWRRTFVEGPWLVRQLIAQWLSRP